MLLCCFSLGVSPALLWRCWPRNLPGLSMRPWQLFLRLPPSLQSPCFQRACLTRVGTSCGRYLWRRSGGPLQMFCSATHLSRAVSEAWAPPFPPLPCEASTARAPPLLSGPPRSQGPPQSPGSRAHHQSNILPCHLSPVSALSGPLHFSPTSSTRIIHWEARLATVRPPECPKESQRGSSGEDWREST